ncbi:hypothetical protein JOL79_02555 [Microbispora sp. RL4-1S]|uniref:Uncharacterized protein n=1 Tax=Microbispora oryzae TaxID=2806554 RepID=A0A940WBZ1_9ACTN|nr:hypothetical protein [Microbispora oryzae]MBP2702680.1 hypothetical protein [Microbispora oryzae]
MSEPTRPPGGRSTASLLLALGVIVTGLALAVTALLPWAGVTARLTVLDAEITRAVRGVDRGPGWFVMGAGLVATLLGVLGVIRSWLFTGLAILPGAVAAFALAMFLTDPKDLADRLDLRVPGLLSIEPAVQYGWFAGLLASVAVAVLAAAALLRRR